MGQITLTYRNTYKQYGKSEELKNIIQYISRNKNIKLIAITSHLIYTKFDLAFLMPSTREAGQKHCSNIFH